MQSGISASQELTSAFNELLGSSRHFGLLVTIKGEALVPVEFLTPTSPSASFASSVDKLLVPRLQEKEALYILLRRYDEPPRLVAATYVPDSAPVRQKMLFASTRLTLVRELGSEHFRETLFATTVDELSGEGFRRHDAHTALEAPLTEEERTLGDVKRAEQEAGHGTGTRDVHLSRGIQMQVAPEAIEALRSLGGDDGRALVMLKINPSTEAVELVADSGEPTPTSITELVAAISATEPRFTFFRYAHAYGGGHFRPLLFFYTCPASAGARAIKFRMMYPLMKRAVLDVASSEAGLTLDKKFEVEEPSELTEETVLGELHPQVEQRKGFSRPKRPGR